MPPRIEEKGKGHKTCCTRFIIEEAHDSYLFIPIPLSSQGAHLPMHPTPPHMHHSPPISGSFIGLLSTFYFSIFPPISELDFIIPPRYTPFMHPGGHNTPHPTSFPKPSMQVNEPKFSYSVDVLMQYMEQ